MTKFIKLHMDDIASNDITYNINKWNITYVVFIYFHE